MSNNQMEYPSITGVTRDVDVNSTTFIQTQEREREIVKAVKHQIN